MGDARLAVELWLRQVGLLDSYAPKKHVEWWQRSGARCFVGALIRLSGGAATFDELNAIFKVAAA